MNAVNSCPKCADKFDRVPHLFILSDDLKVFIVAHDCVCVGCNTAYAQDEKIKNEWYIVASEQRRRVTNSDPFRTKTG